MMNPRWLISVLAVSILLPSCYDSARRPSEVAVNRQPVLAPQKTNRAESLESIFTQGPSLSYEGYTVSKQTKNVDVEGIKTEASYALLRKGGTTVATFDGLYHPAGNSTQFGLLSFLGGETKQLVVEQSTPRNWSHWIVQLVPDFQMIFNSGIWSVDGELIPVDVNQDGIFEFTKTLTILYDFHKLPTSESPLIPIVFMYDRDGGKYVPANQVFQDYSLKGIEDEVKSLNRSTVQTHLAGVLHVLMRYIYAGKKEEGWAFFERDYNEADKDLIKSEIVGKLSSEPVYKFIYGQYQSHSP